MSKLIGLPEQITNEALDEILNLEGEILDLKTTIRDALFLLLETLWKQGEGFNGKRPLGNSGWDYDFYKPLIQHGYVHGSLDDDGFVKSVNETMAFLIIKKAIQRLQERSAQP